MIFVREGFSKIQNISVSHNLAFCIIAAIDQTYISLIYRQIITNLTIALNTWTAPASPCDHSKSVSDIIAP